MILTCLKCNHSAEVDTKGETDPLKLVYRCSECGSRTAHGQLMPKVAIAPSDKLWIVLHIDGQSFKLDRDYAFQFAANILSLRK